MTALWCDRDACFCDRVNLDRARPLSHVNTRDSGVCNVYILRRLQWISSTVNEIQLHRGKINYDLYVACENSDKIRVSTFTGTVLSFNVLPKSSG